MLTDTLSENTDLSIDDVMRNKKIDNRVKIKG